jgi:pyridoxamine 5'-phosphate oxidase
MEKLKNIRRDYASKELTEDIVNSNPIIQFKIWMEEALESDLYEPTAMHLATVNHEGKPSGRMVLLKGIEEGGFVFYTNYQSRKGKDIQSNPHAALTFFWPELERQVRIEGLIEKVRPEVSDAYFHSRPYSSRVGAATSPQSHPIESREELETLFRDKLAELEGNEINRPEHWGGYVLIPSYLEFWQGRPSRLHDRISYEYQTSGRWKIRRLAP